MVEQQLSDINFDQLCAERPQFYKSPVAWEDQVLYFLLPDRFSNGDERDYKDNEGKIVTNGTTPMYSKDNSQTVERQQWEKAGTTWVGGNIKGIISKLGYLKRMGVTAIWLGPVFKQVPFENSYHGYGIQNFLDVDPSFGTREDLKKLAEEAHGMEIYVIMDIILNHTGNVFTYAECREHDKIADKCGLGYGGVGEICEKSWNKVKDTRWDGHEYKVEGFRAWKNLEKPESEFAIELGTVEQHPEAWPDGAIWPREFQNEKFYNRQGSITNWDYDPEYLVGDFVQLKDLNLQNKYQHIDDYEPQTGAIEALCKVYKFWIAYADIDGFRIDTVKHVDPGAIRYFASSIHEFAQSIGKENFYLIGEITGGRNNAFRLLELTGIDAALGIDDVQDRMINMVKGDSEPALYFNLFRNSLLVDKESHTWFRNKVVTMADDHDKVSQGECYKKRFCADIPRDKVEEFALNMLAVNATTMGIPCIYYGSEQCFDGQGGKDESGGSDRFLREAMFGGAFGAFQTHDQHFFNEDTFTYRELAKVLEIRANNKTLLRGRQFLREISGNGMDFGYPRSFGGKVLSIIPWSRIFNDHEVLVAFNSDMDNPKTAWVIVDRTLHNAGDKFTCIYSSNDKTKENEQLVVESKLNQGHEVKAIKLSIPASGFVIYEKYGSGGKCNVH